MLREAMKVLAADGLTELIPSCRKIVSQEAMEGLADSFPALAALERLSGKLASTRATAVEVELINTLTADLRKTVGKDRPRDGVNNHAIRSTVLSASGSETLIWTHATIAGRVHRARYQSNLAQTRWEAALEEHVRMAGALKERAGPRLGALPQNQ